MVQLPPNPVLSLKYKSLERLQISILMRQDMRLLCHGKPLYMIAHSHVGLNLLSLGITIVVTCCIIALIIGSFTVYQLCFKPLTVLTMILYALCTLQTKYRLANKDDVRLGYLHLIETYTVTLKNVLYYAGNGAFFL